MLPHHHIQPMACVLPGQENMWSSTWLSCSMDDHMVALSCRNRLGPFIEAIIIRFWGTVSVVHTTEMLDLTNAKFGERISRESRDVEGDDIDQS